MIYSGMMKTVSRILAKGRRQLYIHDIPFWLKMLYLDVASLLIISSPCL